MTALRVGTRRSKLAIIQTDSVIGMLKKLGSSLSFEKVLITTAGDKSKKERFSSIGAKGIFEKEIDAALARGEIDFAVHSLKDVPSEVYNELVIGAIPKRESPNDVLVSNGGKRFLELATGSVIGTSSPRRMIQVKHFRPDLKIRSLRGNVEIRVGKVLQGNYDAIIVAEAGLKRLRLDSKISERLSPNMFTPAPGQGALAVVVREDNKRVLKLVSKINDKKSMNEVLVERRVLSKLEGGCQVPIGVIARQNGKNLRAYACTFSIDGRKKISSSVAGKASNASNLANQLASNLVKLGAEEIVNEWRKESVSW